MFRIRFTPNAANGVCPRCGSKHFECEATAGVGYAYEEVCQSCGYAMAGNPYRNGLFDVVFFCKGYGAIRYKTKAGEWVSIPFDSEVSMHGARRILSLHLNRKYSQMQNIKNVELTWLNGETGVFEEIDTSKIVAAAAKRNQENRKQTTLR